ncbi:MAG: DegV family protein [Defluviitaleaceae bacterium]|nr:DegV family protein [Defluviitaleaceae bacterium]
MLRIVADTGSDIAYLNADAAGVEVIELDIRFDDFAYDYRNDPDFNVFYDNLTKAKNLPTTSQVTPGQYLDIFEDAKEKGDEVLAITISGGLSGTYSSAVTAQEMCGYKNITVVDSKQCSISLRMMVEHAVKMRGEGQSRAAIAEALQELRDRMGFLVMLDTLTYLKKGGRVPPAMAFLGEILNMKPIVTLNAEGKVEAIKKARGFEAGKKALWAQFESTGYDKRWPVCFGYTQNAARGEAFLQESKDKYGLTDCKLLSVGGVIGTHAGPNAIAIGYVKG